jgi:hypothetical protein
MNAVQRFEPRASANYIADMSATLASLARDHGFTDLARVLEMARLEAEQIASQIADRPAEPSPES